MRIIVRFLTWLLDLSESKIARQNLALLEDLKQQHENFKKIYNSLQDVRAVNNKLAGELTTMRDAARKSDTTAIVSSDNVRAMQDKFNQLKRHGRALRYSIGQACFAIEAIASNIGETRHACEHETAQLYSIARQMRSLGCIPPKPGQLKPEDFISDFHPSMLDDNPVDAFKPAREIVGANRGSDILEPLVD